MILTLKLNVSVCVSTMGARISYFTTILQLCLPYIGADLFEFTTYHFWTLGPLPKFTIYHHTHSTAKIDISHRNYSAEVDVGFVKFLNFIWLPLI